MKQIINKHNKKVTTKKEVTVTPVCNCRVKDNCPLDRENCMKTNVVYKAVATTVANPDKTYIGVTEGPWKHRHSVHKTSFKYRDYTASTSLTDYVWKIKDEEVEMPQIKWTIEKTRQAYNNVSKRCILCLQEKLDIIEYNDQENLLNKRSELANRCVHANKFLLKNYKNS